MVTNLLHLFGIFFARLLGVSCNVVRILFLVKERRLVACCIGFFEVMIYILVLGSLLGSGKSFSILELLFYCGGFAAGNYVGAWLEEYLLNSFVLLEIITDNGPSAEVAIDELRAAGVGATVINGIGLEGPKLVVRIFCRRRDIAVVQKIFIDRSFMTILDVRRCIGGWFPKRV